MTFGPISRDDRVRLARSALVAYDAPPALPAPAARAVRGKVVIDLDDADSIARAWSEIERVLAVRATDPELRVALASATDRALAAGRIDEATADRIRAELDEATPAVVLEAHSDELIEDRPLGEVSPPPTRPVILVADELRARLRENPGNLRHVVAFARGITTDTRHLVELSLAVSDAAGIDRDVAEKIILVELREPSRGAGHE
jgi:hypothetical protein